MKPGAAKAFRKPAPSWRSENWSSSPESRLAPVAGAVKPAVPAEPEAVPAEHVPGKPSSRGKAVCSEMYTDMPLRLPDTARNSNTQRGAWGAARGWPG